MKDLKRIMIVGGPGSGKSTLARLIGDRTGLPVFHIDHCFWKPGWEARPRDRANALIREIHGKPEWVFEGNRSALIPERAARADLMIFLDLPLGLRLWRVFRRTIRHWGQSRPDMTPGCPERFSWDFIWWIVSTARRNRQVPLAILADPPAGLQTAHLRSPAAVRRFLERFTA